jgi:hypothetical protein
MRRILNSLLELTLVVGFVWFASAALLTGVQQTVVGLSAPQVDTGDERIPR